MQMCEMDPRVGSVSLKLENEKLVRLLKVVRRPREPRREAAPLALNRAVFHGGRKRASVFVQNSCQQG